MSTLLEKFYVLFDSDTTALQKGTVSAKKDVDKLQDSLSDTEKVSKKLGGSFLELANHFKGLIVGALGAGAIVAGLKNAAAYTEALGVMADSTGVAVETLDAWSGAVERAGGDAYSFQWTVRTMTQSLEEMVKTGAGEALPYFSHLGIKIRDSTGKARDFISMLPELAEKFEGLSKARATTLGEKLGLDYGTILLLQKGRVAVEELIARQKELGLVTKRDVEVVQAFDRQWADVTQMFRALFTVINTAILPIFTSLLKHVENLGRTFKEHSDVAVIALSVIGAVLTATVLPALIRCAIASWTFLAPYVGFAALIILLAVLIGALYEDVKRYFNGQSSLIGRAVKQWPLLADIIDGIVVAVKWLIKAFSDLGDIVDDIFGFIVHTINEAISDIIGKIKALIGFAKTVASFFGFGDTEHNVNVAKSNADKALHLANTSPIGAQTSNSIRMENSDTDKSTNLQIGAVTINSQATDSAGIARDFGADLQAQMRQATNNLSDGVAI